jgi:putative oxygen-independent coproporphyrinogen III oxidase
VLLPVAVLHTGAVPSRPPEGDPVPDDGSLPADVVERFGDTHFGAYVHIPFCSVRCGYCDFNTYTAAELGHGASRSEYADTLIEEVRLAGRVLGADAPALETVFFGGGTPTLLPAADLVRMLSALDAEFGLDPQVEVTVEANPDSVDPAMLRELRAAGVTRMSFGWQATAPHVLAVLDRTHDIERGRLVVQQAFEAGFEHVSIDLIYGTPGERDEDLAAAVQSAVGAGVDHVSAYSLIIEEGTALAHRVARGDVPAPDDDTLADRYIVVDDLLTAAGYEWYEVSNWARPGGQCRHNLGYWRGFDWWGFGPGAHSHVGGVRWWNVRHPSTYADRLRSGTSPGLAHEVLSADQIHLERVLLGMRLRDGLTTDALDGIAVADLVDEGLVSFGSGGRIVLTRTGRLLADQVVRRLT